MGHCYSHAYFDLRSPQSAEQLSSMKDKLDQEYKRRILAEFASNAFSMNIPINNVFNGALNATDLNGLGVPIPISNIPITTSTLLSCLPPSTTFMSSTTPSSVHHHVAAQPLQFNPSLPSTSHSELALRYLSAFNSHPAPQPIEEIPPYTNVMDNVFRQFNRNVLAAQVQSGMLLNAGISAKTSLPNLAQPHLYNPNLFSTKVAFPFASTVPSPSGSSSSSCNASEIDSLEDRLDDIPMRKKERAALVPSPDAPNATPTLVRLPKRRKAPRAKPFENFQFQAPETSGRPFDDSRNPFINGQHIMKAERTETSPPFSQTIPADFRFFDQDMDHENDVSHVPTIVPHQKKFNASTSQEQRTESSISPSHAVPVNSSGSHSPELNVFAFGETVEKRRKLNDVPHAFNESGNVKSQVGRVTEDTMSKNFFHILNTPALFQELLKSPAFLSSDLAKQLLDSALLSQSVAAPNAQTTQPSKPANPTFAIPTAPAVKSTWTSQATVADSSTKQTTSKPVKPKLKCRKRKISPLFLLKNAVDKKRRNKKRSFKSVNKTQDSRKSVEASKIPDDPSTTVSTDISVDMQPVVENTADVPTKTSVAAPVAAPVAEPTTLVEDPILNVGSNCGTGETDEDENQMDDVIIVNETQVIKDYDSDDDTYLGNGKRRRNVCASFMRPAREAQLEEERQAKAGPKKKIILTPDFFEDIVVKGRKARSFPINKAAVARSVIKKTSTAKRGRPKRMAAVVAAAAVRTESVPIRKRKGQVAVGTYTAQDEVDTEGNTVVTHDPTLSCGSADDCSHPDQLSLAWIRCDSCSTWFHRICIQFLANIRVLTNDLFVCGCTTSTHEVLFMRSFCSGRKVATPPLIEKIVKITNIQIALRARAATTGEDPNKFDSSVLRADLDEIEEFLNSQPE
ncbi:unnamed protein product [Auanema sp. JU1783]|nr:unnamed protein product [Auanema sp. JU1783]